MKMHDKVHGLQKAPAVPPPHAIGDKAGMRGLPKQLTSSSRPKIEKNPFDGWKAKDAKNREKTGGVVFQERRYSVYLDDTLVHHFDTLVEVRAALIALWSAGKDAFAFDNTNNRKF